MINDDNAGTPNDEQDVKANDNIDVNSTDDTDLPHVVGGILLREGSGDLDEELVKEINESDSGDESNDQDTETNKVSSKLPGTGFEIVGLIAIFYGFLVGFVILVRFIQDYGNLFGNFVILVIASLLALGGSLIFVVPGVICYGIAKILKVLEK